MSYEACAGDEEDWDTYRNSFDDEVHVGKVVELGAGDQTLPGGRGIFFGYPSLADIFLQQLVGELQTLVNGGLGIVDESHGDRGFLCRY